MAHVNVDIMMIVEAIKRLVAAQNGYRGEVIVFRELDSGIAARRIMSSPEEISSNGKIRYIVTEHPYERLVGQSRTCDIFLFLKWIEGMVTEKELEEKLADRRRRDIDHMLKSTFYYIDNGSIADLPADEVKAKAMKRFGLAETEVRGLRISLARSWDKFAKETPTLHRVTKFLRGGSGHPPDTGLALDRLLT